MRGGDQQTGHLFSYLSPEQRVPQDPSAAPEQLLRAFLIRELYAARSALLDGVNGDAAPSPALVASQPRRRLTSGGSAHLRSLPKARRTGRHP